MAQRGVYQKENVSQERTIIDTITSDNKKLIGYAIDKTE